MLQKIGCINRFDVTRRLIASSAFERAIRSSPARRSASDAKGWSLPLLGPDRLWAQDLEARGASASETTIASPRIVSGALGCLPGDRAEPLAAHPPAPGMKHLIETDGFIPLSHDR
jgi:hypothetical protein